MISNINQRPSKTSGGRPAIIVNRNKYQIQNLTNTLVTIPWGIEMVWALLTPKSFVNGCIVKHIVLGALYVRPSKPNKSLLYDHITDVYNVLNTKYGKGLYWCIAGDTNQIKLDPILHLSTNLKSVVTEPTRINHKNPKKSSILDNIITDLHKWYQKPILLPPIAADPGQGKPSDHLTVVYKPLIPLMNKSNRKVRSIEVRPLKESGLELLKVWLEIQNWEEIENTPSPHHKAKLVHATLMDKINEVLPIKTIKVASDDQPWCNEEVKRKKRLKEREYRKHRKSDKYISLSKSYETSIKKAKSKYYKI